MPELPEVETTRKSLEPLIGQTVADVVVFQPKLRWPVPDDLSELKGSRFTKAERRAKYLILSFEKSGQTRQLIVHLGMSGSLQQHAVDSEKRKHDHVIIDFQQGTDGAVKLSYHDPRRFGAILWHADYATKLFDHLGPEPLSTAFSADYLHTYLQKTSRPIKSVIMDQACVVGVGNIYATESLFFSRIHPLTPAKTVSKSQAQLLHGHIQSVLQAAIDLGGSTLRDYTVADGKTGYFQQTLEMYGRKGEPCNQCGAEIENVVISQRASTFCPMCQMLP